MEAWCVSQRPADATANLCATTWVRLRGDRHHLTLHTQLHKQVWVTKPGDLLQGFDFAFIRRSRLYDECSQQTKYEWDSQYIGGRTLAVCSGIVSSFATHTHTLSTRNQTNAGWLLFSYYQKHDFKFQEQRRLTFQRIRTAWRPRAAANSRATSLTRLSTSWGIVACTRSTGTPASCVANNETGISARQKALVFL